MHVSDDAAQCAVGREVDRPHAQGVCVGPWCGENWSWLTAGSGSSAAPISPICVEL